ncbi:MAG: oxidoreductase [Pseudomonadota bacterium]
MKPNFKSYLIDNENGQIQSRFTLLSPDQLDPGEVSIKVAYSSVNYKDALATSGAGRIVRRYPCVGGIDLSGIVEDSKDARFVPGDAVLATSFDLGIAHHGGYAEYARVPASWVYPLPTGLSLIDAMALGTAGFTAALGIVRMEENGLTPERGPVIVSGASGGVGSLAVNMLANLGYTVSALTSKSSESDYLKHLGASTVIATNTLELPPTHALRPLGKATWAGAIDNLGGDVLAWIASTMQQGGTIASIGLAASAQLNTTVMPFILRGVSLLGIDSGYIGEPYRSRVWQRLASDLRPPQLKDITQVIPFSALPETLEALLQNRSHGRWVVAIDPALPPV